MHSPATSAASPESIPLQALVVDDTATNRQILSVFLRKLGHRVEVAENGAQAVEKFAAQPCDIVIMDVMMPVMDGYEATRRIKAIAGERWVPVIFLSALDKDENLVAGLDAGGDDYLSKPVNFIVLEAKLRSMTRALLLRRELEETRNSLQRYHDAREAENQLAGDIYDRQMRRPGLDDAALHFWMNPATDFSGDIVAAARLTDGRFYALLADATGHGLPAAISVLPALTLFYDMAEFGLPLGRVVAKINSQLRAALPVGRFVCASLLCFDPAQGRTEVWMGGMPAALLIGPDGQVVRTISSEHLPLGIDDFDWRKSVADILPAQPAGSQLLLMSDGLIEARNSDEEEFGLQRLTAALAGVRAADRLDAIKDAVFAHLHNRAPHDDVTVMLIDLPVAG